MSSWIVQMEFDTSGIVSNLRLSIEVSEPKIEGKIFKTFKAKDNGKTIFVFFT